MSQDLLYYTITIAGNSNVSPADGFIDNNSASSYILAGVDGTYDVEAGWATNLADALAKARANLRWKTLIEQISLTVNPYAIQNITATGATSSASATSLVFTLVYDRPDYLYAYDELNPGLMLYNNDAIQRWVARALLVNINVDNYPILDPTAVIGPAAHYGQSLQPLNAAPLYSTGTLAGDIAAATAAVTVVFETTVSGIVEYPL